MSETKGLIETQCARCAHEPVCSYKELYAKIIEAISEAYVELPGVDKRDEIGFKKIKEFDFINYIVVSCKYYKVS